MYKEIKIDNTKLQSLTFANVAASLITTKKCALCVMPSKQQIEELWIRQGYKKTETEICFVGISVSVLLIFGLKQVLPIFSYFSLRSSM